MSQGYAIELYFDPALENQVLKAWNVLARRQISTQLIELESRPHITLLSSPSLDPPKLQNVIKNFSSKQEPLALTLSSVGSFPSESLYTFIKSTNTDAYCISQISVLPAWLLTLSSLGHVSVSPKQQAQLAGPFLLISQSLGMVNDSREARVETGNVRLPDLLQIDIADLLFFLSISEPPPLCVDL